MKDDLSQRHCEPCKGEATEVGFSRASLMEQSDIIQKIPHWIASLTLAMTVGNYI